MRVATMRRSLQIINQGPGGNVKYLGFAPTENHKNWLNNLFDDVALRVQSGRPWARHESEAPELENLSDGSASEDSSDE